MKSMTKLLFLSIVLDAFVVTATAQTTWKLSKDVLVTNNQISFSQGANGVWYILRSSSFKHLQNSYQFLSAYQESCVPAGSPPIDGLACWINPVVAADGNQIPLVGVNFTSVTRFPDLEHG